ncbi:hypothetical protein SRHO_G00239180 [Serrasalmus rhombeus]
MSSASPRFCKYYYRNRISKRSEWRDQVGLGFTCCRAWTPADSDKNETRERSSNTAVHMPSSALHHENGVIYSSVDGATKNNTVSPAGGNDGVIYSSVVTN